MKSLVSLILFLSSELVLAAGGSGPASLVPAAVNVTILVLALVFLLKKPASEFFANKSTTVSEMLERASAKAKEAEMMMQAQKKKADGMEAEIKKLETEADELVSSFEKQYSKEVQERISKMKEDASVKIEAEKKELMNELNSNLLDLVISKTKTKIKSDSSIAANATKNIVEGL